MQPMIDKLNIFTNDFVIADVSKTGLQCKPGSVDLSTGESKDVHLFTDKRGTQIQGSKAYLNTDKYNVNIDGRGLAITFNPSKFYHPYELVNDMDKVKRVYDYIVNDLIKQSFNFNPDTSLISRIDLSKNREVLYPISEYKPLFSSLNGKRVRRQAQYPEGYMTANDSYGIIFYDKHKEQNIYTGHNLMRGELQLKKGRVVKSVLKLDSMPTLYKEGMNYLNEVYNDSLNDRLFRNKIGNCKQLELDVITYSQKVNVLKALREQKSRGAISEFIQLMTPNELTIDELSKIMIDVGIEKSVRSRNLNKYRTLIHQRSMLINSTNKTLLEEQYKEIYTKFVA